MTDLLGSIGSEGIEELRVFVGPDGADYYLYAWTPILTGRGRGAFFNWAAFLIPGLWLPYRKMYLATIYFYGIALVWAIAEDANELPGLYRIGFVLIVALICGTFGNRWYLSYARRVIAEVKKQVQERHAVLETLPKRGGTSLISAIGVGLFALALFGLIG